MNKADGAANPNRSGKPADAPDPPATARAGTLVYDSDRVPVLIRLPDLTTATRRPPSRGDQERHRHRSRKPHSEARNSGQPASSQDAAAENRRRPSRGGLLAAIPSQALVVVLLVAITALAYALIRGVPPAGNKPDNATANVSASADAPTADRAKEPELWPADGGRSGKAVAAAEPGLASAGPAPQPVDPGTPTATQPTESPSTTGDVALDPTTTMAAAGEQGPLFSGPNLNRPDEPTESLVPVAAVEPVQGWPPESGGAPRSAELPSDRPAGATDESATFNGTIEFPQPRVDHERTRSGIY